MSKIDGKLDFEGHTLVFNVNVLCDLEEAFGAADVNEVLARIQSLQEAPSLRTIRTIFAVSMAQEEPDMTEKMAGEIISEHGIERAAEALGEAIALAFPEQTGEPGKGKASGSGKKS